MEAIYRSYYTKSDPIVNYMVNMLSVVPGMRVLEPCAGDGVFVDTLIQRYPDLYIDIYELNPKASLLLKNKYKNNKRIKVTEGDTLTSPELNLYSNAGGVYDRIIANPPYGGWQEFDRRADLKKLYSGLYVKETYSLFLLRCIQLLREGGVMTFIIPDTYLNLHMHTSLRRYIWTHTVVKEICLIPSSFFPGVNFGYANLSIITLQKVPNVDICMENSFRVMAGFKRVSELEYMDDLVVINEQHIGCYHFKQAETYKNIDHALFISDDVVVSELINSPINRISDIADCVTGFYSGNDKIYLRAGSLDLKNSSKYQLVDKNLICEDYKTRSDILEGIDERKCFIPIVKGGATKYLKRDDWFMDWSKTAVKNYKSDKKARFQNPNYYFKYGIAVPMISSRQLTASLIENKLFDQSIVGVFPHNADFIYYLLAYFNSQTCNKLIRTINPSANNPANYIKKIPFAVPSGDELKSINMLVGEIISELRSGNQYDPLHEIELNNMIQDLYGL